MNYALSMELRNRLCDEISVLRQYADTLDSMAIEEKNELLNWIAQGRSVNYNPYMLYSEKGSPLDLLSAMRINEDVQKNPHDYL